MKPGAELDALVAETVMGWKDVRRESGGAGYLGRKPDKLGRFRSDTDYLVPELVPLLKPRIALAPERRAAGDAAPQPDARGARRMPRIAYHAPCSLQHGQRIRGVVESSLAALGFDVRVAANEAHLCCGSAGTYSVLHPEIANALRDRKLGHLAPLEAATIVSANIGCIQHLQSGTPTPVRHWIEVLDDALGG